MQVQNILISGLVSARQNSLFEQAGDPLKAVSELDSPKDPLAIASKAEAPLGDINGGTSRIGYAGFSHLRPRAALYAASITLTRAAASRGLTSAWSF